MNIFKYLNLLFLFLVIVYGQDSTYQKIGFNLKYASLPQAKITRVHHTDIYGNGLYSVAKFNFSNFTIVNSMFATSDSMEAIKGGHKRVKGIFGYTNQAYLDFRFSIDDFRFDGLFGREYLRMGFSKGGSLLIGDESRPFDQVLLSIRYKNFIGQMVGIQLENIGDSRRYLAIHTLEWTYRDKIKLLFCESLLYSGSGRSVEWQYFNPVIFWTPEIVNTTTGAGNGFIYSAFLWHPKVSFNLWAELFIDDYQVNRESKGDLEPNEIGFIAGMQKTGFPYMSSDFWFEYTSITNRTYQTPYLAETYTHRDFPIGHYLGNDFDMLQTHYEQQLSIDLFPGHKWINSEKVKLYGDLAYIRDGANGLDTPWDEPWMDSTVTMETGYSEPFPTRPITYVTEAEIGIDYQFKNGSFINAGIFIQRSELQGVVDTNYTFIFRLWINLLKTFHY